MAKPKITPELKEEIEAVVADFNRGVNPYERYITQYRGAFLYLGHQKRNKFWPICRLTYTGNMDGWEFAIYKYSDERYDPDEWFFPGADEVDGTIQGAMRAGLKAYSQ